MAKAHVVIVSSMDYKGILYVCTSRALAEESIKDHKAELAEMHDGDDCLELSEYEIEEHNLIE